MTGWRGVIGHVRPAQAVGVCQEWRSAAPRDVALIESRTIVPRVTEEGLASMMAEAPRAVRELAQARPGAIVHCCAIALLVGSPAEDIRFCKDLEDLTGIPSTTMTLSMVEAVHAVGGKRIGLVTSYAESFNAKAVEYFRASGFDVGAVTSLREQGESEAGPEQARQAAREAIRQAGRVDVLVLSFGGVLTFDLLEGLEDDSHVPVVSSNQAALWRGLRLAGLADQLHGLGRLFADH